MSCTFQKKSRNKWGCHPSFFEYCEICRFWLRFHENHVNDSMQDTHNKRKHWYNCVFRMKRFYAVLLFKLSKKKNFVKKLKFRSSCLYIFFFFFKSWIRLNHFCKKYLCTCERQRETIFFFFANIARELMNLISSIFI